MKFITLVLILVHVCDCFNHGNNRWTIRSSINVQTLVDVGNKELIPTRILYEDAKEVENKLFKIKLVQNTESSILHPTVPLVVSIETESESGSIDEVKNLIDNGISTALNLGGRPSQIQVSLRQDMASQMDFLVKNSNDNNTPKYDLNLSKYSLWCKERTSTAASEQSFIIYNILGRIAHFQGNIMEAITYYTEALKVKSDADYLFRHIGSVYHEKGDLQLAFASYQRSIELNPKDTSVYLKLAYLYEDLAKKDWNGADENAKKCYDYYLSSTNYQDINGLIRYGNFLSKEHQYEQAIDMYSKAIGIDSTVSSVWFNKAYAEVKIRRYEVGKESLQRVLALDPNRLAAQHMLTALDDIKSNEISKPNQIYISELFDNYADDYDEHVKKLKYSAPRIIREEISSLYQVQETSPEALLELNTCVEAEHSFHDCGSHGRTYNLTLDILDLGCGTGLAGSWLKDFAKTLVGVDVSPEMVKVAKKKNVYNTLHTMSLDSYFHEKKETYDVVMAADVLPYLGDLTKFASQAMEAVRPGGYLVFSAESLSSIDCEKGYKLQKTGRFGYTKEYIDSLFNTPEYTIAKFKEFSPRFDEGVPVDGFLYIIQRK